MECSVCNERSEVDACVECRMLLCEVCGAPCEQCHKMVCPEHKRVTHKGHVMCVACYTEREERHAKKSSERDAAAGGGTSLNELDETQAPQGEITYEALSGSARQPPPPWQMSLYTALAAAALALLLLVLADMRTVPTPWGGTFATPYSVVIISLFALFWSVRGMINEEHREDFSKCFFGLGIALVASVLALWEVSLDKEVARTTQMQEAERLNMGEDDLKTMRERMLGQFGTQRQPPE